jgi:hypothetical protein
MRKIFVIAIAAALLVGTPAFAGLQNLTIGGSIRIRGNYYSNTVPAPSGVEVRWPGFQLPARPIGDPIGGQTITSIFSWDEDENDTGWIEQRTRLNAFADFSDEVSAFIEIDSYDNWGEDFRSNYITGADARAVTNNDVEIYQAYVQADQMFDMPISMRVGRQEMPLGNQWLVGVNDAAALFTGLSFDAIRFTYATDEYSLDVFGAELFEGGVVEEDEDIWLYGVYGSYMGIDEMTLDAYWLFLRDARSLNDTNFVWAVEWIEDWVDVDDYDATELHTFGLRGSGTFDQFDYEAEIAYQTGDADQAGFLFKPFVYGDDDAEFDNFGANVEVGYTFDMDYQPRVWLGGAYLGGEDERDLTFWEWLNPFDRPDASVSFNRLFSNMEYSEFIANTDESNMWIGRGGVSIAPSEKLSVDLLVSYFDALEAFDAPRHINLGRWRVPLIPNWSWWTEENDSTLGWEVGLYGSYAYSEDLTFNAGWAHLFVGDGLADGNFTANNGLGFTGGSSDDDADYLFLETTLNF